MGTGKLLNGTNLTGYNKSVQFAAALGYYALICLADRTILAPLFGYQGLVYRSPPTWTQIGVIALILLCTAVTPVRYRQPSDGVLYALLPLVVIPVLAVSATDVLFANIARDMIVSISGAYLLLAAISMIPRSPWSRAGRPPSLLPWLIGVSLSVVSYTMMFATFGIQFRLLSFSDVYNVRAVFNQQGSGLLNYLLNWQANVINPFFIAHGVQSRRILPLLAGTLGDFLIYSTTGYKSVLFSALAAVIILLSMRQKDSARSQPAMGTRLAFAFAALVAVAYTIDTASHTFTWTSLFIRRLSLVAGVNSGFYFQYFSFTPKTHLAYGIIGKLTGNTAAIPPSQQISLAIYHSTTGDPNVNIWADAYANFGHVGVIVFTLVLAAFLWFYDRVAYNADKQMATILITVSSLSLANSALFTCLLTHGMLLALLIISQSPQVRQAALAQGRQVDMATVPQGRHVNMARELQGRQANIAMQADGRRGNVAVLGFPPDGKMKLPVYWDQDHKSLSANGIVARPGWHRRLSQYFRAFSYPEWLRIWPSRDIGRAHTSDHGKVRKAGFIVLIGSGLGSAVGLLITPLISRVFDPAIYGEFALITGVASVFVGISSFRLEVRCLRAPDDAEAAGLIWLGLLATGVWTAVLTIAAGFAVVLWHVNVYWLSIGILVFLASLQNLGPAVLTRARRYRGLSVGNFVQSASMGVIQLLLGLISPGVGALLVGFGASRLGWLPALRKSRCKMPQALALWRKNRNFTALAGSAAFLNALTGSAPILLVSIFYGNTAVGQLAIGIRVLVTPLGIISQSASLANLGEVSQMLRVGDDSALRLVQHGMRDLFAVGLIPCVLAGALGAWAVPFVLGQKWREAGLLLAVQAAGALAQFVAAPFSQLLNVTGDNRRLLMWDSWRFVVTVLIFCVAWKAGMSPVWAVGCWSIALVVVYGFLARLVLRAVARHQSPCPSPG